MASMERPPALIAPPRAEDPATSGGPEFEEFFEEHHVALFRALWLVTRNRHEAEEVMHRC